MNNDVVLRNGELVEFGNNEIIAACNLSEWDDFNSDALSDVVTQLPDGWPNILQLLVRHSWDFTSVIHPSVNKAMSQLDLLQMALYEWHKTGLVRSLPANDSHTTENQSRHLALPSSESQSTGIPFHPDSTLCVLGIGQKTPERVSVFCPEDVIEETITLLARLEKDRQETLESLRSERNRVTVLGQKIDQLAIERMTALPLAVQLEHESCANDINELNWHVTYRSRLLSRLRSRVGKAETLNSKLLEEISHNKKHIPLMEEKLDLEGEAMDRITAVQKDTDAELTSTLQRCAEVTEKSKAAFAKAEEERTSIKKDLNNVRSDLTKATNDLENAKSFYASCITNCKTYVEMSAQFRADMPFEIQRNKKEKEKERKQREKVDELENRKSEAERNFVEFDVLRESLTQRITDLNESFGKEEMALVAEMESKDESVRLLRRKNRELEMERDTRDQKIKNCEDKKASDERNMDRMQRELESTAEMLETIRKELKTVVEDHQKASEKLDKENRRCQAEEDAQKATVDFLKKTVKEELNRKMNLKGRIEADHEEYEKMQIDSKARIDMSEGRMEEVKAAVAKVTMKLNSLTDEYQETTKAISTLQKGVEEKKNEKQELILQSDSSMQELVPERDRKRDDLSKSEAQYKEMMTKADDMMKEIEGIESSSILINRSDHTAKSNIERLQAELEELTLQLSSAQRLKSSLLKSLSDVTARDMALEMNNRQVMLSRQQILHKLQTDLDENKDLNKSLASTYRQLQNDLIRKKLEFVHKFEKRIKLENEMKDIKQILCCQTRVHAALQHYYKYRHLYSTSELTRMQTESKNSGIQLTELHEELDRTFEKISEFLQNQLLSSRSLANVQSATDVAKKIDSFFRGTPLPQIAATAVAGQ